MFIASHISPGYGNICFPSAVMIKPEGMLKVPFMPQIWYLYVGWILKSYITIKMLNLQYNFKHFKATIGHKQDSSLPHFISATSTNECCPSYPSGDDAYGPEKEHHLISWLYMGFPGWQLQKVIFFPILCIDSWGSWLSFNLHPHSQKYVTGIALINKVNTKFGKSFISLY